MRVGEREICQDWKIEDKALPRGSMYGIFTYIYHKNQPNVGKYMLHGSYGLLGLWFL